MRRARMGKRSGRPAVSQPFCYCRMTFSILVYLHSWVIFWSDLAVDFVPEVQLLACIQSSCRVCLHLIQTVENTTQSHSQCQCFKCAAPLSLAPDRHIDGGWLLKKSLSLLKIDLAFFKAVGSDNWQNVKNKSNCPKVIFFLFKHVKYIVKFLSFCIPNHIIWSDS